MATYVPNALDETQPTEDKYVESAAAEFRELKGKVWEAIDDMQQAIADLGDPSFIIGTAHADLFSGNGTKVDFILTRNPGKEANLDVSISGVTQRPGPDYVWNSAFPGTQITFVTAPIAGTDNILVRYMEAIPVPDQENLADPDDIDHGDALIAVRHPALGGVARTQHDKNLDWVSVRDFGAIGAGTTDDTAAIQAAHNASYSVYYPDGYYLVTGKIKLRVGTKIQGASAGSTHIQLIGAMLGTTDAIFEVEVAPDVFSDTYDFTTEQAGIVVRDIMLDGKGFFAHGFLLQNIRFPIFENVWIFNFNGAALLIDYAEEGYFNFLNINGCGRTGGNVDISADTLYGSITFDASPLSRPSASSNFLRFNDGTIANDRCSGTIMTKGNASPSRIYFSRCQSEVSGVAVNKRDWFIARGLGGIFWFIGNDVVNYRNIFDQCQYVELYAIANRMTNNINYYNGANGTGSYRGSGNLSSGGVTTTSIQQFNSSNDRLGDCVFNYIFNVMLNGCLISNVTVANVSGFPSFRMVACQLSGDLVMDAQNTNSVVGLCVIGGKATFGNGTVVVGNKIIGTPIGAYAAVMAPANIMGSAWAESTIVLPRFADVIEVSNTTTINSIADASYFKGRRVTLIFLTTLVVADLGNLKLVGNFSATPGSTLTLACNGVNFYEVSRTSPGALVTAELPALPNSSTPELQS